MNKCICITGASSGIGASTAGAFAEAGWDLVLIARREDRLKELQAGLLRKFSKINCTVLTLDVQDKKLMNQFFTEHASVLKNVDVIVNNAGLAKGTASVSDANIEDWEAMIDTNIKGLFYFTRGMLPFLEKRTNAHIVNLGSVAGRWVYPGGAVYCATRFAVSAFTEGLRMDLNGKPIRVTQIDPGMVETEFSEVRFGGDKETAKKVYDGMTPLTGKDIAETIFWSVMRPQHVNIQEIVVYPTDQAAVRQVHRRV